MAAAWLRVNADSVEVQVLVNARASRDRIAGVSGERLRLQVTAAPVDGEANRRVLELVAKTAGLPPGAATLASGASSRAKKVRLACDQPRAAAEKLEAAASAIR